MFVYIFETFPNFHFRFPSKILILVEISILQQSDQSTLFAIPSEHISVCKTQCSKFRLITAFLLKVCIFLDLYSEQIYSTVCPKT